MALPLVGIEFIASNADDFIDIFNKIVGNVAIAGDQVQRFTDILNPFDSSVKTMSGGMNEASTSISGFDWVMHTLSNTFANIAAPAIMTFTNAIASIPREADAAVSAMQDMEITLETLVAGDFIAANANMEMSQALASAVPIVDDLMLKLEELSVASPFQYQQILSVFQMNKSFGMATEMAFETTRAITNLASTMKGVPGITQRLSYNFSQMSMIGKITGRDLRDLRMAGLDLEKVFQKQLGKTVKEVNEELASGKIIFDDVSKAFVAYVDKYIGPAAQRASRTLGGLKSTMADIKFFAFGNVFKSAGDELAKGLGTILDAVLKILRSNFMKEIGVALGVVVEGIMDFAMVMFKPLLDAADDFDKNMEGRVEKMFDWGMGMIEALADGIVAGLGYLVSAITAIGSLLASWLMPSSPPKVAPNIDKWGLDTAREWLNGFTEVDYSILDDMQSPLKQTLSTLMSMGKLGAGMDEQLFADISKSMIAALSGQKDFGSVISQVQKATGPFGQDMAKLVTLQFDYAKATEEAAKAEERLIAAQKAEYDATNKVYSSVKEYNDMLRSGASKKVLKDKMAQVNASRKEQMAARENRNEAGKQYQAVQENMQAIQKQIAMQQKLVDTMLELANAYNDAQKAREAAEEKGKGGGKAGATTPTIPTPAIPDMDSELQKKLDELKRRLQERWDEMTKDVSGKIIPAWNELVVTWGNLKRIAGEIKTIIGDLVSGKGMNFAAIEQLSILFGGGKLTEKGARWAERMHIDPIEGLKPIDVEKELASRGYSPEEIAYHMGRIFEGATPGASAQGMIDKMSETFTQIGQFIEDVKTKWAEVKAFWETQIVPILMAIAPIIAAIGAALAAAFQTLAPFFDTLFQKTGENKESTSSFGETVINILTLIGKAIVLTIFIITTVMAAILSFVSAIQNFFGIVSTFIATAIGVAMSWVLIFLTYISGIFQSIVMIVTHLLAIIIALITGNKEKAVEIWESLKTLLAEKWDAISKKSKEVLDGIGEKLNTFKTNFETFKNNISTIFDNLSGFFSSFATNVSENFASISGFFDGLISKAQTLIDLFAKVTGLKGGVTGGTGKTQTKAEGGAVHSNKPYIVGEEGPEWFIPPNSGRIIPNNMPLPAKYLGSSSMTEVNNSVSVSFGAVTITNAQEGAMFEQRVERAVRKALGG